MIFLRQSTQVIIRVGSFVDPADAVTPVAVVLGATDQAELLKANGAATADISGSTWAAIAGCGGWYNLTLTIGNTGTLGDLTIVIQDADVCLPVWVRCMVMPANVWNSMFGADVLHADVTQVNGAAQVIADFRADVTAVALEANVEGHCDDSLTTYDPPTRAEATTDKDEILAALPTSGQPDHNVSAD